MRVATALVCLLLLSTAAFASIPRVSTLRRAEVTEEHIADHSISSAKLQQYIVDGEHIRNRAVGPEHIKRYSVDEEHFAERAVTAKSAAVETVVVLIRAEHDYSGTGVTGGVAAPVPGHPNAPPGPSGAYQPSINPNNPVSPPNRRALKPKLSQVNEARIDNHYVAEAEFYEAHAYATGPGVILGWYPSQNGHLLRYQADRALRSIECGGVVTENIIVRKYDTQSYNEFVIGDDGDDGNGGNAPFVSDPGSQDITYIEPLYHDTIFDLRCGPIYGTNAATAQTNQNYLDGGVITSFVGEDNNRCSQNSPAFPRRWQRYDISPVLLADGNAAPRSVPRGTDEGYDDSQAYTLFAVDRGSAAKLTRAVPNPLSPTTPIRTPDNPAGTPPDRRGAYLANGPQHARSPPERCSIYTNVGDVRLERYNEDFPDIPGPAEGVPIYSPTVERIVINERGLITVRYAGRGLPFHTQPDVAISVVVLLNNKMHTAIGGLDGPIE